MERLGLVGLPNSGKSSLFNALTGGHAVVAPHPFSTTETLVGVAPLPDPRLDALAVLSQSKKVVHATMEIVDIAGLAAGSASGEGLGNRFLAGIREVDALLLVLRAFKDDEVMGDDDPLVSLETLELELVMADVAALGKQGEKRRKQARIKHDAQMEKEADAIDAALAALEGGTPVYRAGLPPEQRALLRDSFLLTDKRLLAEVNVSEDQVDPATMGELVAPVAASLGDAGEVIGVCVQLEAEAAQLPPDERTELLEGLGLGEGVVPRLARTAFHLLGLRTFLTTGDKESRAWTFRAGAHAPECAGVIHSDLERGFIRAEVIHWDELVELGGWPQAKSAGRLRVEGKEYEVLDGDVLEIRFNV
jgi:GTP-binding protein YchF